MKKLLMLASTAALLAGCYTANYRRDYDAVGAPPTDYGVYTYQGGTVYSGTVPWTLNTNTAFGPVRSGAEAAIGPGTGNSGALWEGRR